MPGLSSHINLLAKLIFNRHFLQNNRYARLMPLFNLN